MTGKTCILIGAPVDSGKRRQGCLMGPDAFRTAELAGALSELGHQVEDIGNVVPEEGDASGLPKHIYRGAETIGWTRALQTAAYDAMGRGFPIFMGGDHSLSLGTVTGVAKHAKEQGRPQFVLWLDAHTDYHTPASTTSGNLHGTPLAYANGLEGFTGFPTVDAPVPAQNICIIGLRSVDPEEKAAIRQTEIHAHDMREIDENGIARPLARFLEAVKKNNGMLHVSLDVDFLDPDVAPAVGTTVPGGTTVREAHLVMEMLHDSDLMTSLDLVELNPFLDVRGRTAQLMVELTASALGRNVFDRPTPAYS